jgi:hypothetical protein
MQITKVKAAATINIGDYVQMGKYYNEPILWRCVDIDENGPLMLADRILTIKPFDAKGTHTYLDGTPQADTENLRREYGSNLWETSNMRSWLNSTATAGNVTWHGGNPPTASVLWNGYNAYANEKGFLAEGNFTASERSAIKSVTQKSILNDIDELKLKDGGTAIHTYSENKSSENVSTVVTNYDTAYYHNVTDRMFLLDIKQIDKVYQNRNTLGTYYHVGKPTQKAVDNSDYKTSHLNTSSYWYYWLRTPWSDSYSPNFVRSVYSDGCVSSTSGYDSEFGVRPAFYIKLSSVVFISGDGQEGTPYIVDSGITDVTPTLSAPSLTPTAPLTPTPSLTPTTTPHQPSPTTYPILTPIVSPAVTTSSSSQDVGFAYEGDRYSFTNRAQYFRNDFIISEKYLNMLIEGMSNTVKKRISDESKKRWDGSCYGMGVTYIGFYLNELKPDNWSSFGKKTVTTLDFPRNDVRVNDLINYYQLMQFLPDIQDYPPPASYQDACKTLVTDVKQMADGDVPVLVGFVLEKMAGGSEGHAVVAYGIYENDHEYTIPIYDPVGDIAAFIISKDFNTCRLKWNSTPWYTLKSFQLILNDPNLIDLINAETSDRHVRKDNYDQSSLLVPYFSTIQISDSNGHTATISQGELVGNLPISKIIHPFNLQQEGEIVNSRVNYVFPEEEPYTTKMDSTSQVTDLSMCYINIIQEVYASLAYTITFNPDGEMELTTEKDQPFSLSMTFNNPKENIPWSNVTVYGNAADITSLSTTAEGLVLSGEGLTNITITGEINHFQTLVEISIVNDKVLIKPVEDASKDIAVYIDSDDNGSFDKRVLTGETITPTPGPSPVPSLPEPTITSPGASPGIQTTIVIGSIFGGLLLIAVVLILIRRKVKR